jgi:hypothetical protein
MSPTGAERSYTSDRPALCPGGGQPVPAGGLQQPGGLCHHQPPPLPGEQLEGVGGGGAVGVWELGGQGGGVLGAAQHHPAHFWDLLRVHQ